ncbi:DUF4839 domain-containing protein [Streptomyces filamentosus]|uniref:DUF4839 domain-containing protein n=1 Tax=Streptomyces filamentosus TaxID=67294 RepID=A0A919BQB1_STRFL|nr:DUF4839 domain-containing protein [Streptomyces filamentosus]GHG05025.1 hypothetical protein GCM10017667_39630 [Streptomyces filamentosus]
MADVIRYEHKTVQAVRGTDGLVISKMQKDGWELVGQTQGMLRSTLDFRRPKKPVPRLLIGAAAGGFVVLAIIIGVAAALEDEDEKESSKPTTATASAEPSATPAPAGSATAEVITAGTDAEFAALLKTPDSCDSSISDFATKHMGKTIAFDGSIVHMAPHGDYNTRYDFLLGPDDQGPKTEGGPAFKYEDTNTLDLKLTGRSIPETVRAGDKFRFVAEVGEFNAKQCLFFLNPVSTEVR